MKKIIDKKLLSVKNTPYISNSKLPHTRYMSKIKKIAVFTSGGDAPGMNACIRAVVRTGLHFGCEVVGIMQGFQGMIDDHIIELDSHSVSNLVQLGGTVLKTARCEGFKTPEGMQQAYDNLKKRNIDALVAIGGDGTLTGIERFSSKYDMQVIGIPGTIDNDLYGSDYTLGFDTATNTVIEAIDKIRDTADSHARLFFVEVMGRDAGCIALRAGIAAGAEAIMMPEQNTSIAELIKNLELGVAKNKSSAIVIVSEGDKNGGAFEIAKKVKEVFNFYDTKVTILGHLQRGGSPSAFDRILASRMGFAAVKALLAGETRKVMGLRGNKIVLTDLLEALNEHEFKLEDDLVEMSTVLA